MKSKSIYRSGQYWKQLKSINKDPKYDLITPNGIIRHFIVFIEAEEVKKLVIPVGIIGSKRVKWSPYYKPGKKCYCGTNLKIREELSHSMSMINCQ